MSRQTILGYFPKAGLRNIPTSSEKEGPGGDSGAMGASALSSLCSAPRPWHFYPMGVILLKLHGHPVLLTLVLAWHHRLEMASCLTSPATTINSTLALRAAWGRGERRAGPDARCFLPSLEALGGSRLGRGAGRRKTLGSVSVLPPLTPRGCQAVGPHSWRRRGDSLRNCLLPASFQQTSPALGSFQSLPYLPHP